MNFALFSEHATAVELCLFDPDGPGRETRRIPIRERTDQSGTSTCPSPARAALRLPRARPLRARAGPSLQPAKLLIDPTPRRSAARSRWSDALFGYAIGDPGRRPRRRRRATAPPYMPKCVVVDPAFTWGDDRPPRTPWNRTVIYEVHVQGLHHAPSRASRAELRGHVPRPRPPTPSSSTCSTLGVTAVELLPVHQFVADRRLVDRGLTQLLGLQLDRLLRPARRATSTGGRGEQVAEFKTMVKALHRAGHRGDPRRGLQPHRRGQPAGPDAVASAASTTPPTTGSSRRPAPLHGLHRLRQQPQHAAPAHDPADHGQPALLGARDARRRLPLRPRPRAGPRAVRRRPAGGLLRHHPPGPGHLAGEAHRRALGPRRRRLPGRQLPGRAGRSGTASTATRVRRFWRGDAGQVSELAYRLTGSSDLYEASGRRPYASINFVTAHDGFTLHDLV